MRIPISASLVALAVTGVLADSFAADNRHSVGGRVRKSLGFGPELPHAVFNTSPEQAFQGSAAGANSPFGVAESFVSHLLRRDGQLTESSHYELRGDSYTDDNTGVTHVYFRQLINGLEVSDGLINVNVKNGVVISYGDSVSLSDNTSAKTLLTSGIVLSRVFSYCFHEPSYGTAPHDAVGGKLPSTWLDNERGVPRRSPCYGQR